MKDIVQGYLLLADKGSSGEVYNQGSMRTNSVLSYILLGLERAGWDIEQIEPIKDNINNNANKTIKNPTELNDDPIFGVKFDKTRVDQMEYTLQDKGINVQTDHGKLTIESNQIDSDSRDSTCTLR